MLNLLKKWWNKPGDDLCSAMDFAFEAGTKAARKECAELVRTEALHWKAKGQADTRDFEICALLIERSNAGSNGPSAQARRSALTEMLGVTPGKD